MRDKFLSNIPSLSGVEFESIKKKLISDLFSKAPLAFAVVDLDGKIVFGNEFLCKWIGYTNEELETIDFKNLIYKEDGLAPQFQQLIDGEIKFYQVDKRYVTKDNRIIWGNFFVLRLQYPTEGPSHVIAIIQDVTEKKEAELKLKQKQDNLISLIENTDDLIWSIDRDYNINICNSAFKKTVKENHNIDMKDGDTIFFELMPKQDIPVWKDFYNRALSGETHKTEYTYNHRKTSMTLDLSFNPIISQEEVVGVNIRGRDITLKKKKEIEAECQKQYLLQVQKEAKIGSWRCNKPKNHFEYTDSILEFFHINKKEVNKDNIFNLIKERVHPDDKSIAEEFENKIITSKKAFNLELRLITGAGQKRYLRIIGGDAFTDHINGDELQIGSIQDITSIKLQEINLLENQEMVKALVNNTTVGVALVDTEGTIFQANQSMVTTLGYPMNHLLKKNIKAVTHPSDFEFIENYFQKLNSGEINSYQTETRFTKENGEEIWAHLNVNVVRNDKEKPMFLICQIQDITERKNNEAKIKKIVEERTAQLQAVNKELEAFSYSVSHDLRAPLRSINGFSHALLEDYSSLLDEEGQLYLNKIYNESIRMGQLIDDMLRLSRISQHNLHHRDVNLAEVANTIISGYYNQQYPGTEFIVEDNLICKGDVKLLNILLENLISNACKYSSKCNKPLVKIGKTIRKGKVAFYIQDNGVGFDMEYVESVYNAFERLPTDAHFEGTGVGLAIVKRIIERHDGQIWARAKKNEGATFYFYV